MSARQADMFRAARTRRDTGIERGGEHADRVRAQWRDTAAKLVLAFAEQRGVARPFLTEDAAAFAYSHGLPQPPDPRAWGAAMKLAKRRGYVIACGFAPAKSSNLSPKVLWRIWNRV